MIGLDADELWHLYLVPVHAFVLDWVWSLGEASTLTYGGPVKWLRQGAMASGKRSAYAPFPFGLTVLGAAHLAGQGGGLELF